ncbi:urea transporter [Elizabethkingia sp. JS20170427COW]|nr:urea transporter [Elizabethkingia sp. JS20170427COW]QCX54093.1 urea transporter [Elizabethkingia sp. JS20170427COW]
MVRDHLFLAVYISRPISALYALAASAVGALSAGYFGINTEDISLGLFGFNTILTAIVFSGGEKNDGLWVLLGSIITIFVNIIFVEMPFFSIIGGVFTFSFVVGTWITLAIQQGWSRINK